MPLVGVDLLGDPRQQPWQDVRGLDSLAMGLAEVEQEAHVRLIDGRHRRRRPGRPGGSGRPIFPRTTGRRGWPLVARVAGSGRLLAAPLGAAVALAVTVAAGAGVEEAAAVPAADGAAPARGPRAGPLDVGHVLEQAVLAEALTAGWLATSHRPEALRLVPCACAAP